MNEEDLCFTPATALAAAVAAHELSPVEIVDTVLARIERLEPRINAFATLTADRARDAAKEAEAQVMSGAALGPLHGVPVTIKDLANTAGIPTQRGSHAEKGAVPAENAPCVDRLAAAGAISLGKTTTSEFGWKGVSQSPLTGITHNPWAHGMNAGASSAGAGAGAAAGYGPLHQGSDGAGSIRMPSHFCGIFGIKPSFGRVAHLPVGNVDQISHVGPMTRTVADAALMLRAMAGPHLRDHYSLEAPPADYPALLGEGERLRRARIAWSPDLGHARVDAEVASLVADAVSAFAGFGAEIEEVSPAWGPDGPEIEHFFWAVHETSYAGLLEEFKDRMDPGLVACIRDGRGYSAEDYLAMRARKLAYVEAIHGLFDGYDFLLTPSVSVAAFPADRLSPAHWPHHEWNWLQWAQFSYPFNLSHNPAASIPCGFTEAGLPVGLQVVGRRLDDLGVLQAAAAFEAALPWADRRPQL